MSYEIKGTCPQCGSTEFDIHQEPGPPGQHPGQDFQGWNVELGTALGTVKCKVCRHLATAAFSYFEEGITGDLKVYVTIKNKKWWQFWK